MDMLSMYTSEELSEMLYLRRQIEELQRRYDAIVNKTGKPGQAPASAAPHFNPAASPLPVPASAPAPVFTPSQILLAPPPAAVPLMPVPAPAPYPQQIMQPVMPAPMPQMQAPAMPLAPPAMKAPVAGGAAKSKPAAGHFFKPGAGPIAKPGGQKSFQSPIAIPGMKQGAPQASQSVSSSSYQKIREYAVSALSQACKPLTFDNLFDKIAQDGCPLPSDKPKVVVRKVLCNSPDVFTVTNKGLYTISESYVPEAAPQPAPVQMQPAIQPVMQPQVPIPQPPMPIQPVQQAVQPQPIIPVQPLIQPQAPVQPIIQQPAPAPQPVVAIPVQPPPQPVIEPPPAAPAPAQMPARKPAQAVIAPPPSPVPPLDTVSRKAITSSGSGSIRERATAAILNAGRPLSLDEVFDKLKGDGYPLPPHNAKDIVKTVINNKELFQLVENGRYRPIKEHV